MPDFKFHRLNEKGIGNSKKIQSLFELLFEELKLLTPVGREQSIVATKLEEACFFAKKGMAIIPENQESADV